VVVVYVFILLVVIDVFFVVVGVFVFDGWLWDN